jgi:AcrR family transcriptional regulator
MNVKKTDGRSRRAVQKRQARRSDILNAAVHLFSNRGFHATSISDLIEEAGISRGTFYLYFDSKEALFLDLMDLFAKHIMDVVEVVDQKLNKLYGFLREMVEGALTKGANWGIIRQVNEQVVTTALIGAIKEVFYHHLVVEPVPVPDREAITTSLFEFSTKGLLSA